ncbi:MAG: hypothetical protein ACF8Q5_12500 [Phycisphaerales bacterium JB040]
MQLQRTRRGRRNPLPTSRLSPTPSLPLLAGLLLALAPASLAHAQAPEPDSVELSSTPYQIESVGLTIFLPVGATATTDPFGGSQVATIIPANKPGVITIQDRSSTNETLTPQDIADGILKSKRGAFLLTRNQGIRVDGRAADRLYMRIPDPGSSTDAMWGVTVVQTEPGRFAIFELQSDQRTFAQARKVYEAMVGAASFYDAEAAAQQRAESLKQSSLLLRELTPEDYERALSLSHNRWERLYTPSPSGNDLDATEHGYRRIKAWRGKRGELSPNKPRQTWSAMERQDGYIVQIDAKLLERDIQVHTEAIYFLSEDRREEAWTLKMALRDGPKPTVWTETGARSGSSLTVTTRQGSFQPTTVEPEIEGVGYLSVLETYILGPLLIAGEQTGAFSFYSYQSSTGAVRLRQDTMKATERGFELSSRYPDGPGSQVTTFAPDGSLIRVMQPDGKVWAPIDQNRLVQLWDAKGLLDE